MKLLLIPAALALLVIAGAIWLLVGTAGSQDEAVLEVATATPARSVPACDQRATPPPGKQLWRWLDLTVLLPKEGFRAYPEEIPPESKRPNGGPGLNTGKYDVSGEGRIGASLLIDAETGAIVHRPGAPEHGKATGIALCPFDRATAPWPYNGDPPPASTTVWPSIHPDPATGMYASFSIGSGGGDRAGGGHSGTPPPWVECELVFEGISVSNGRSHAFVGLDPVSNAVCKDLSNVQPEDLAAFERFLDRSAQCDLQNAEC